MKVSPHILALMSSTQTRTGTTRHSSKSFTLEPVEIISPESAAHELDEPEETEDEKNLPLQALPPRPLAMKTRRAVQTRGGGIQKNAQEGLAHRGLPPVAT